MGARAAPTLDDVHGETAAMTFLETSRGGPVEVSGTMTARGYPPRTQDQLAIVGTQPSSTFADNELRRLGPNPRVQAFDRAAGYHESFDGVIAHFVNCLEIGAAFQTGPVDNFETLRLVEHA
jgi:D-apiose dehydrogenase